MAQRVASLYAEISADTRKLDRGLKKSKQGMKGLGNDIKTNWMAALGVVGAVTAGLYAMKKAYDFGREGAQLDFIAGKFANLSAEVGRTSDGLMTDLRAATRGMVADSDLMANAGNFMSLGLAKTSDEVLRLTTVAGALGMNLNQLTLTLTNKTTMRFDALGVSVDGFKEKVKKLEAAGLSADDAFKEAFLQQAEQQVARVGEVADSAVADFIALEVSVQNLKDTIKMKAEMGGFVSGLKNMVDGLNEQINVTDRLTQAEQAGVITGLQVLEIRKGLRTGAMDEAAIMKILTREWESYWSMIKPVSYTHLRAHET